MPEPQVRVVGSAFTTLEYDGRAIAWLERFSDSGQQPVGQAWEAIYELGTQNNRRQDHAKEIVTNYTLAPGTLTASIRETWEHEVWQHLKGLAGTNDILDIWEVLRRRRIGVNCKRIIRSPNGLVRGRVYFNCTVTGIPDGDTVSIGDLSVLKDIQITYTHKKPI